mmetsp:Transcript_12526/g.18720  ORF Transcript_12526/g.18720 Transcript_12526/m.18720 type:complete len:86 (+) Transcript_12526:24-281(+)
MQCSNQLFSTNAVHFHILHTNAYIHWNHGRSYARRNLKGFGGSGSSSDTPGTPIFGALATTISSFSCGLLSTSITIPYISSFAER